MEYTLRIQDNLLRKGQPLENGQSSYNILFFITVNNTFVPFQAGFLLVGRQGHVFP